MIKIYKSKYQKVVRSNKQTNKKALKEESNKKKREKKMMKIKKISFENLTHQIIILYIAFILIQQLIKINLVFKFQKLTKQTPRM